MFWLALALHILGYDLWFYVSHRLLHTRLLTRFHGIHHQRPRPMWLDTYHGHWTEGPFQSAGFLLPLAFGIWSWPAALVGVAATTLRGCARHETRLAPWLGNHHLLHHLSPSYNYGEFWLDTLCGTRVPERALEDAGVLGPLRI
jgi:sterol desaturase/sphingolipid hydroxylase (fatty acid hydroxylase superfamily)